MKKYIVAALIALMPSLLLAQELTAQLSYQLPTEREDGTPLPVEEIQHIELRYKGGEVIAMIPPTESQYTLSDVQYTGGLCFEALTVDTNGLISDPAEVCLPYRPGTVQNIIFEFI